MIGFIHRMISRRVRVHPACFADHRQQWQIDQGWQLIFDARVKRNLMEREAFATVIGYEPDYIPEYLRLALPAILKRQAA